VEVEAGITDSSGSVVVEETGSPDAPGLSINKGRDGLVQESDGGSVSIVVSDPSNGLSNAILRGSGEARAELSRGLGGLIVDLADLLPEVGHVEHVSNTLNGAPVLAKAVIKDTNMAHDGVEQVHGRGGKGVAERELGGIVEDLVGSGEILVDSGDGVGLGCLGVEDLESINSHGVDGMGDGLVVVGGHGVGLEDGPAELGVIAERPGDEGEEHEGGDEAVHFL